MNGITIECRLFPPLFTDLARCVVLGILYGVVNNPLVFVLFTQICREQFVALHNEPILEELHEHFHKNYSDLK